MRAVGHTVTIYSADANGLRAAQIDGAEIVDVRDILPSDNHGWLYREQRMLAYFSDVARVAMLLQDKGTWADADCFFLAPLPDASYVFGLLCETKISNAVLRAPPDSPLLADYFAAITAVPLRYPWATPRRRLWREFEILLGRSVPRRMGKSSIGPRALTHYASRHGLMRHAAPPGRFYPVSEPDATLLVDPDPAVVEALIGADCVAVHCWQSALKRNGRLDAPPPPSSWLGRHWRQFGL